MVLFISNPEISKLVEILNLFDILYKTGGHMINSLHIHNMAKHILGRWKPIVKASFYSN